MSDEKQKEKQKYETEWSFSFANLGESISNTLTSLGIGEDAEVKTDHFAEALDDAAKARIVLEPTVGQATITALADSDNLIEADVTYIGEMKFEVKSDGERKVATLRQQTQQDVMKPIKDALGSFARRDELRWDMRLTPNIPLDVTINSGVTANDFDLRGLQLTELRYNGGTGKTDLNLPTMGKEYPVTLNSGTGELNVTIADGAAIDLKANNGTGKTTVAFGRGATADAHIAGGIGQCTVIVPADAAVRIKAATGLGKINVPENFIRVKLEEFVGMTGTWETPNYKKAEHTIDIRYEGGIGGFNIKFA